MAAPTTFEEHFDQLTKGGFAGTEVDANAVLNFRRFDWLAKRNLPVPYRGSGVVEVNLTGADTDQYLIGTTNLTLSADATQYYRIVFLAQGLTMAASDRFTVFTLRETGAAQEVTLSIVNTAGTIQIGASETAASTAQLGDLIQGVWHTAELFVNLDNGVGNDGTIDFWLDGYQIGSQITALDQGAITDALLGAIGVDAGTTAGRILFSEVTTDDARLYPHDKPWGPGRFAPQQTFTDSRQFFVGPGWVDKFQLLKTSDADEAAYLFDTDDPSEWATAGTPDSLESAVAELTGSVAVADTTEHRFLRGCYVHMTGTNPRCAVKISDGARGDSVGTGPNLSEAGVKLQAFRR